MTTHFQARAMQRAGVSDPDALFSDLRIALRDPDRWHEYIELVKDLGNGAEAYRFRIENGIFYVVATQGRPMTIYTQSQMASTKWAVKARKAKLHPDARLRRYTQHRQPLANSVGSGHE